MLAPLLLLLLKCICVCLLGLGLAAFLKYIALPVVTAVSYIRKLLLHLTHFHELESTYIFDLKKIKINT